MNEKIEELVKQCTTQLIDYDVGAKYDQVDYIKFAELIVKECINEIEIAKMCDPYTGEVFDCEINYRLDSTIDALKEDFGIK
jgi:hypothetical protein